MGSQEFCLHWKNHHSNLSSMFSELLSSELMVDVTLACDGLFIKAHKIILSACSPFFKNIFIENPCKHPTIILKDMRYNELKAIIDFMYNGELVVAKDKISSLLDVAQSLMVKGLSEVVAQENLQFDPQTKSSIHHNNHKKKNNKGNKRLHSTSSSTKEEVEPPIKKNSSPSSTITNSSSSLSPLGIDSTPTSDKSSNNSMLEADKAPDESKLGNTVVKIEPYLECNNNNAENRDKDNPIENNLELLFEEESPNSQENNNSICSYSEDLQGSDVQELAKIFLTRTASKRHYPLNIPGIHSPSKIPPTSGKKYPSRVCRMCPGRRETRWECAKCSVALHPQDCFEKFHNP